MSKTVGYVCLLLVAAVLLMASFYQPFLLSDENVFLKNFVNHEFLNVLGVILAITLASAGQLHLKFNEIEEKFNQKGGLAKTRSGVHEAVYFLIALFLFALFIVVVKPIAAVTPLAESIFNSGAIFILVWNVLILIAITKTIFNIKPEIND